MERFILKKYQNMIINCKETFLLYKQLHLIERDLYNISKNYLIDKLNNTNVPINEFELFLIIRKEKIDLNLFLQKHYLETLLYQIILKYYLFLIKTDNFHVNNLRKFNNELEIFNLKYSPRNNHYFYFDINSYDIYFFLIKNIYLNNILLSLIYFFFVSFIAYLIY